MAEALNVSRSSVANWEGGRRVPDGETLLLLSKTLDYSFEKKDTPWASSALRSWLNTAFIADAFTDDEIAHIQQTSLSTTVDPKKDAVQTSDQIFILASGEIEAFFPTQNARICEPTQFAIDQGLTVWNYNIGVDYWLRDRVPDSKYYRDHGTLDNFIYGTNGAYGLKSSYTSINGIRPALWYAE